MALNDIMSAFGYGTDPNQPLPTLTPDSIKRKRLLAEAMQKQGMDFSPIASPWQGAARIANALVGTIDERRLDRQEREGQASAAKSIADILSSEYGGGGAAPAAAPRADAAPTPSRALPAFASDVTGGINAATAKYGLDPSYLPTTAALESSGNPAAANPNSSARGLFQFTSGTARQYGLTNPNDPNASADAAARLALDNRKALVAALGRDPTPAELYLAHQQGAGGAAKLLANPNAPAAAIVGDAAVRLNGGSPGMTAGEFANKWLGKFNSRAGTQVASADPNFAPQSPAYAPPQQAMQMPPGMGNPAAQDVPQAAPQPGPLPAMAGGNQQMQMPPQAAQAQAIPQQIAQAAAHPQVQAAAAQAAQTPQGQQLVQQARGAPIGAIVQALSNPWMSDGQKSLLLMIAKEKMEPVRNTVDLGGSIAVMDKQGNILRQIPKQRDALDDEAKRLAIETQRKGLNAPIKLGEGDSLIDPKTYQPIAGGMPKQTDAKKEWSEVNADRVSRGLPTIPMDEWRLTEKKAGAQGLIQTGGEEMNKFSIKRFDESQSAARDATRRQATYGQMLTAMQGFQPGATAEGRIAAKSILKDLGIISGTDVPDAEAFKAAQRRLELAATPKGQGQITENERVLIKEQIPTIANSPEGVVKIVQMLKRLDDYDIQVAKIYRESARRNGGVPNQLDVHDELDKLGPPMTEQEMQALQSVSVPSANAPAASAPAQPVKRNGYTIQRVQ